MKLRRMLLHLALSRKHVARLGSMSPREGPRSCERFSVIDAETGVGRNLCLLPIGANSGTLDLGLSVLAYTSANSFRR